MRSPTGRASVLDGGRRPRQRPAGVGCAGHDAATLGRFRHPRSGSLRAVWLVNADAAEWIAKVVPRAALPRCAASTRSTWSSGPATHSTRSAGRYGTLLGPAVARLWRANSKWRAVRAEEEPAGPDRPPAAQARLDRAGQPALVPGLPAEGGVAAGVQAQGRARHCAAGGLAGWAKRYRIPAFVRLAKSITEHRAAIQATLRHGLSNGLVESINTKIPPADLGGLGLPLPGRPHRPGDAESRRPLPPLPGRA
jgi:transposase